MRIFITGATGCVGQYLVAEFLNRSTHELVLMVRDPSRVRIPAEHRGRVTVIAADLRDKEAYLPALAGVDAALLVATAWGGTDVRDITVGANCALADALVAAGCRHVVYFASASVLDRDGSLLGAAMEHGTGYIRAKHDLVAEMETRAGLARITGVFPTLVFGGGVSDGQDMPMSHFARLFLQMRRWLWLVRRISAVGRFHVIHAADIATVSRLLVEGAATAADGGAERIVLGNPARNVAEMLAEVAAAAGKRHRPVFTLTGRNVDFFIRAFRIEFTPWDRYCLEHPDQSYAQAVNPAAFGAAVAMPDLGTGLAQIGFDRR